MVPKLILDIFCVPCTPGGCALFWDFMSADLDCSESCLETVRPQAHKVPSACHATGLSGLSDGAILTGAPKCEAMLEPAPRNDKLCLDILSSGACARLNYLNFRVEEPDGNAAIDSIKFTLLY